MAILSIGDAYIYLTVQRKSRIVGRYLNDSFLAYVGYYQNWRKAVQGFRRHEN